VKFVKIRKGTAGTDEKKGRRAEPDRLEDAPHMSEEKVLNFMVVDSNTNNALFWEMAIKGEWTDAKVAVCQQGYDAIDQAKATKFDFFVASWDLQPMSGMVLMQNLKEMHRYKHAPYLLFSEVLGEDDLSLANDFGITNYIIKPFEKDKVLEKLRGMIAAEANLDATQRSLRKIEDWIQEGKVNEALKLVTPLLDKKGVHLLRAYTLNGDLWSRTEKSDKAESSYKSALKIDENYAPALTGLGKLYVRLKRFDEGLPLLEKLHDVSPRNLMRMVNLGGAYLESGDEGKAEAMYRKVQALDDTNVESQSGLGKIEFGKGNFDNAARLFRESGKGEELASYFNTMAISRVSKGAFDEGVQVYRNAMKVLPDRSKFHLLEFNIGLALRKGKKMGEAVNAFARSLKESPAYEKARVALVASMDEARRANLAFDEKLAKDAIAKSDAAKDGKDGDAKKAS
jgi:tetratricopeptide (TPR) repeat protein